MTEKLQTHIVKLNVICSMIEDEKDYTEELKKYLPELNQMINYFLTCAQDLSNTFTINEQFVVQVLQDILYGMEHQDSVILLDALRYGLLEIYNYGRDELQSEEIK